MDLMQIYLDVVADQFQKATDMCTANDMLKQVVPIAVYWKRRRGGGWMVTFASDDTDDYSKVGYPRLSTKEFMTEEAMRVELTRIKMLLCNVKIKERSND